MTKTNKRVRLKTETKCQKVKYGRIKMVQLQTCEVEPKCEAETYYNLYTCVINPLVYLLTGFAPPV